MVRKYKDGAEIICIFSESSLLEMLGYKQTE
jgi:hypothetical protein